MVLRILLALSLLASVARADGDKERAARLFDEARALVKQGHYDAACPVFDASYQLDPAIGTELNLGDCYEHMQKLDAAWKMYDAAAREHPGDKREKFARDRADAIAKQMARAGSKRLMIVDEKALAARAAAPIEPPPLPPAPVETHRRRSRVYTGLGLGLVGAAALVVAELYARDATASFDAAFGSGNCSRDITGTNICNATGTDQLATSDSQSTTSGVLAVGGAALLVAGLVEILTAPQDPIAVTPLVGMREIGLSFSARF